MPGDEGLLQVVRGGSLQLRRRGADPFRIGPGVSWLQAPSADVVPEVQAASLSGLSSVAEATKDNVEAEPTLAHSPGEWNEGQSDPVESFALSLEDPIESFAGSPVPETADAARAAGPQRGLTLCLPPDHPTPQVLRRLPEQSLYQSAG